jgi:hypothetical protein
MPRFQSTYRKWHSTETVLLKVWSDALAAADDRRVTLLGLLDLSDAFDCVNHDLLLKRLQFIVGLTGDVLGWIRSFLGDRTQQVAYEGQLSTVWSVLSRVPRDSVLGPFNQSINDFYLIHTADLNEVVQHHGMQLHQYDDDCQLHVAVPTGGAASAVARLSDCQTDINTWMSSSRLHLNSSRSQIMWMGSQQQLSKIDINNYYYYINYYRLRFL